MTASTTSSRGSAARTACSGLAGNDKLSGGLGNDVLTGGTGQDIFVFDAKLSKTNAANKKANLDKIVDFSVPDDTIHLAKSVFTKLAKKGALAKGAFYAGSAAHDKDDRVIYNKKTGALFYDQDGNGSHAAIQFATLSKNLKLNHKDFFVIVGKPETNRASTFFRRVATMDQIIELRPSKAPTRPTELRPSRTPGTVNFDPHQHRRAACVERHHLRMFGPWHALQLLVAGPTRTRSHEPEVHPDLTVLRVLHLVWSALNGSPRRCPNGSPRADRRSHFAQVALRVDALPSRDEHGHHQPPQPHFPLANPSVSGPQPRHR